MDKINVQKDSIIHNINKMFIKARKELIKFNKSKHMRKLTVLLYRLYEGHDVWYNIEYFILNKIREENRFIITDIVRLTDMKHGIITDAYCIEFMREYHDKIKRVFPARDIHKLFYYFYGNLRVSAKITKILDNMEYKCIENAIKSGISMEKIVKRIGKIYSIARDHLYEIDAVMINLKLLKCSPNKLTDKVMENISEQIKESYGSKWTEEIPIPNFLIEHKEILEEGYTYFKNIKEVFEWAIHSKNCIYSHHLSSILSNNPFVAYLYNPSKGITLYLIKSSSEEWCISDMRYRFNIDVPDSEIDNIHKYIKQGE